MQVRVDPKLSSAGQKPLGNSQQKFQGEDWDFPSKSGWNFLIIPLIIFC